MALCGTKEISPVPNKKLYFIFLIIKKKTYVTSIGG